MARPRKEGLSYFPHDVTAAMDGGILALEHLCSDGCGNDGYTFYFKILEMIYRGQTGKYNELDLKDKDLKRVIVKNVGISLADFDILVKASLKVGLFDKKIFDKRQVLTSARVRKTYADVQKQRKRQRKP